ncbi:MAG: threonine/serine exporter family protein [Porphyromonadaceae bacterium]|nr:threonine/serine exporter family protein [Porphyromonadaceae bacterium]
MIIQSILLDGVLAAIAACGFAAVSNPPKQSFIYVPILAAIGHMLRFALMTYVDVEIAIATFIASVTIGFVGIYFAYRARFPSEVFAFPALLPMIPGMYAYRSLLGMIRFMQTNDALQREEYLPQILSNAITAASIMFALGVGVAIPLFIFYKHSFRMTRDKELELADRRSHRKA